MCAASLAVSLGVAEGITRALSLDADIFSVPSSCFALSSDPKLGYGLAPGAPDLENSVNHDGMRDRDFPFAKAPGTFRIACVGDSICFGYGVTQAESLPKQLELLLGQCPGRRYEVLNFGVPGYNTVRVVESVRAHVLPYAPDLIVYVYCMNDPQSYSFDEASLLEAQAPARRELDRSVGLWHAALATSRFLRLATFVARRWSRGKAASRMPDWWQDDPQGASLRTATYREYITWLHRDPANWAPVSRALDELRDLAAARAIPVVLAVVPLFFEMEDPQARLIGVHRQLAEEARHRRFHVLDLSDPYLAYLRAGLPTLNLDATHLTVKGNHYTALVLLASLLGEKLLPDPVALHAVLHANSLEHRFEIQIPN